MTPATPRIPGLTAGRAELAQTLRVLSRAMAARAPGASLGFDHPWLTIAAGGSSERVPAEGVWPATIIVQASWVKRMAKRLPPGDPVFLYVENGRVFTNRHSETCEWATDSDPLNPTFGDLPELETRRRRISEAAAVLKPFLIGRDDLESLVEKAESRARPRWLEEEKRMISAVAKAWALLAPLGVETSDLRILIDNAVRMAWKPRGDK